VPGRREGFSSATGHGWMVENLRLGFSPPCPYTMKPTHLPRNPVLRDAGRSKQMHYPTAPACVSQAGMGRIDPTFNNLVER
jgi:hypothetical protein